MWRHFTLCILYGRSVWLTVTPVVVDLLMIIFIHHIGRHRPTYKNRLKLECGPIPNVMAALPNIGGALPLFNAAVWLTPNTRVPCSKAAKMRNALKFAWVPQTTGSISAASAPSSPYCGDIWGRYWCLTSFFPIVDTCLNCEDIARQSCGMVPRWRLFGDFLRAVFSASRAQHVSDLHSKFTLRPHDVWKYGRHPISDRWD